MAGPLTASIIVDASFEATACSRPRRSGSTCWCCVCCLVPLVDGEALPEFLLLLIWALLSLGADRSQGLWPERRSETLPCLSTVASLASITSSLPMFKLEYCSVTDPGLTSFLCLPPSRYPGRSCGGVELLQD
jgi:hypothetical protein